MNTKLAAGGAAGAIVIVLSWAMKQWGHVELPSEVGQALTMIISLGTAHFTPQKAKQPDPDDEGLDKGIPGGE